MKATTPKPRKKSTVTAKKAAKTGSIVSATTVVKNAAQAGRSTRTSVTGKKVTHAGSFIGSTTAKTLGMQNEPAWVRREVKGLMEALSGR